MLGCGGCSWRGCWEVGTLEVVGGEVGHSTADIGSELGYGLLNLRRVVVGFAFKRFRDSVDSLFK